MSAPMTPAKGGLWRPWASLAPPGTRLANGARVTLVVRR